jgi:VanZ family protein
VKREQIILRLAQLWILVLIIGSLQPARPAPVVGLHRELHWLAFAGVALLLLLLSRSRRQEIHAVFAACLLGLSLEYLQHFIYRNAMEWHDVRDDSLAIIAAFALYRVAGICKAAFPATRPTPNPTP